MLKDFPLTGTGFGTFREVFPAYMPSGTYMRWNEAHSDWLELLLDGGIVAGLLVTWLAIAYAVQLRRRPANGSTRTSWTRVGLLLGLASLTVHAAVDFNHQIPANALLFVALAAMALPTAPRESSSAPLQADE
jgi:O-antigen ligase